MNNGALFRGFRFKLRRLRSDGHCVRSRANLEIDVDTIGRRHLHFNVFLDESLETLYFDGESVKSRGQRRNGVVAGGSRGSLRYRPSALVGGDDRRVWDDRMRLILDLTGDGSAIVLGKHGQSRCEKKNCGDEPHN